MHDGIAPARLESGPEDRFMRLRAQLGVTSFGINQIVLQPGQRGRIHRWDHADPAPPQEVPLPADLDPSERRG